MFDEMKDRIRMIMESQQMSQQEFAQKLGIPPSTLSSIFTGRTNPTNNHTQAIHRVFPSVNINWLMFGEGKMLIESAGDASTKEADHDTMAENQFASNANVHPAGATLFDLPINPSLGSVTSLSSCSGSPKVEHVVKNIDIKVRKVKEIRVFFDDGTYESFVPSK